MKAGTYKDQVSGNTFTVKNGKITGATTKDEETGIFVGEIAYHWDDAEQLCVADVIVFAPYRGRGFGRSGLRLLCQAAREGGFAVLYDDIAKDNPAIDMFLSEGFELVEEKELTRLLKKELSEK